MLSHIDQKNRPRMVDVSGKKASPRLARAECLIRLPEDVVKVFNGDDFHSPKGPVLQTAIVAGVMGAKKTHELIPFCHPLGLENCAIDCQLEGDTIRITCTTRVTHKTGVEMEALTGASVAALTVYDMLKALSHDIRIDGLRLLEKKGGKSDYQSAATSKDD